MPTNEDLGRAIRRLREARAMTIEALALDAGVHPTYLGGIERGLRNPSWERITRVARALDVPVSAVVLEAEVEAQVALAAQDARARVEYEQTVNGDRL